jgi:hypothetical protein
LADGVIAVSTDKNPAKTLTQNRKLKIKAIVYGNHLFKDSIKD